MPCKKKNKSKIWIVVALIIVVVLLVIGIIYLVWSQNKSIESKEQVNKKEEKVIFNGESWGADGETFYSFGLFSPQQLSGEFKIFSISKDHSQIKKLLSQGKLQEKEIGKKFIIRYKKVDSQKGKSYSFNKFNTELEIIEV